MNITISNARPDDSTYIAHLMRGNYNALSFVPQPSIERNAEAGNILLARVNNAEAGYLYHSPIGARGRVHVHQACIEFDIRGQEYGARLVRRLELKCRQARIQHIGLRCADDLPANDFWRRMGFAHVGQIAGGKSRGRMLNCWLKPLQPQIFALDSGADGPHTLPK